MDDIDERPERIRDLLRVLDADKRETVPVHLMIELVGEDGWLACRKAEHIANSRRHVLMEQLGGAWWNHFPGMVRYEAEWRWCTSYERTIQTRIKDGQEKCAEMPAGQLTKKDAGGTSHEDRMFSWFAQLRDLPMRLAREYEKLSERDRQFFSKPTPNPVNCSQYPSPTEQWDIGIFYPERGAKQQAQIDALTAELKRLEKSDED